MTCREVIDFLMHYVDGDLPSDQRVKFERHLSVCPSCVNYLAGYKATIAAGKAAMVGLIDDPQEAFPSDLLRAVHEARRAVIGGSGRGEQTRPGS